MPFAASRGSLSLCLSKPVTPVSGPNRDIPHLYTQRRPLAHRGRGYAVCGFAPPATRTNPRYVHPPICSSCGSASNACFPFACDRLRTCSPSPADAEPGQDRERSPGRENGGAQTGDGGPTPGRKTPATGVSRDTDVPADPEAALRSARTKALVRHARALDAILSTGNADGQGSPEQMRELRDARSAFEKVRPYSIACQAGRGHNCDFKASGQTPPHTGALASWHRRQARNYRWCRSRYRRSDRLSLAAYCFDP